LDNLRAILKKKNNGNFLKFVIQKQNDFYAACVVIKEINGYINLALSPNLDKLSPTVLLHWIEKANIKNWSPILNLQLHKFLGVR